MTLVNDAQFAFVADLRALMIEFKTGHNLISKDNLREVVFKMKNEQR